MSEETKAGTRQHILRRAECLERISSDKIVTDPSAAGMLKAASQGLKRLAARIPADEVTITEQMTDEILRRFEAINVPVLQVLDRIHPPGSPEAAPEAARGGETEPVAGGGAGAEPGALPGSGPAADASGESAVAGVDVRIRKAATALLKHAREKNELLKDSGKQQAYLAKLAEKDIANLFTNEGRWDVEKIHEGIRPIFEEDNLILRALKDLRDAEFWLLQSFATHQQRLKSAPAIAQLCGKILQLTANKPAPGAQIKDLSIIYLIHTLASIEQKEEILEKDLEHWTAEERIAELVRGRYAQVKGDIEKLKTMYAEEAGCVGTILKKVRGQLIMLAQLYKMLGGGTSGAGPPSGKRTPFPAEAKLSSIWVEARDGRTWKVINQKVPAGGGAGVISMDKPCDLKICAKLEKGAPLRADCYINNRDQKNPNARKEVAKNGVVKFAFTRKENSQLGEGRYDVSIVATEGKDPSFRPYAVNVVIKVGNAAAPGTVVGGGGAAEAAGKSSIPPAAASEPAKQRPSPEIVLAPAWVFAREGDRWKRYNGIETGDKTFVISLPGPAEIKICTEIVSGKPTEAWCGLEISKGEGVKWEEVAKGMVSIPEKTKNLYFGQKEMPLLARIGGGVYIATILARDQSSIKRGWTNVEIKVGKGEGAAPVASAEAPPPVTPPAVKDLRGKLNPERFVYLPKSRIYVAINFLPSPMKANWYEAHKAVQERGALMLTLEQFAEFYELVRSRQATDGNGKRVPADVCKGILRYPEHRVWGQKEWIDGRITEGDSASNYALEYGHVLSGGKLMPQHRRVVEREKLWSFCERLGWTFTELLPGYVLVFGRGGDGIGLMSQDPQNKWPLLDVRFAFPPEFFPDNVDGQPRIPEKRGLFSRVFGGG